MKPDFRVPSSGAQRVARLFATLFAPASSPSFGGTIHLAKNPDSLDLHPAYLGAFGRMGGFLPFVDDNDTGLLENLNLIQLRVEANAAVAHISLSHE